MVVAEDGSDDEEERYKVPGEYAALLRAPEVAVDDKLLVDDFMEAFKAAVVLRANNLDEHADNPNLGGIGIEWSEDECCRIKQCDRRQDAADDRLEASVRHQGTRVKDLDQLRERIFR